MTGKSHPFAPREGGDDATRTVAGTFQCDMQLSQQRRLIVTGHVFSDDTADQINERIDCAQDAMDRQYIRTDLMNKRAQREATIQAMEMHRSQLEELRAMQGDSKKLKITSQQREILNRGDESLRGHEKNIKMLDSLIAAAEKKLGIAPA